MKLEMRSMTLEAKKSCQSRVRDYEGAIIGYKRKLASQFDRANRGLLSGKGIKVNNY